MELEVGVGAGINTPASTLTTPSPPPPPHLPLPTCCSPHAQPKHTCMQLLYVGLLAGRAVLHPAAARADWAGSAVGALAALLSLVLTL